jgi:recombinational DNA repair protein (RecF pathway)
MTINPCEGCGQTQFPTEFNPRYRVNLCHRCNHTLEDNGSDVLNRLARIKVYYLKDLRARNEYQKENPGAEYFR